MRHYKDRIKNATRRPSLKLGAPSLACRTVLYAQLTCKQIAPDQVRCVATRARRIRITRLDASTRVVRKEAGGVGSGG